MRASTELDKSPFDLQRLVVFCDAVFAIVITLLVLPVTSEVEELRSSELAGQVWGLWPHFTGFTVSFLVVGRFWMVHHRMYARFVACDANLVRLSLVNLLTVTFTPFPEAVLGEHLMSGERFPVVFYAVSLTATSLSFTAVWLHAVRRGLVDQNLGPLQRREATTGAFVANGVFLISVGAAFFGLLPATLCWLVLLPAARSLLVRRQRARAVSAKLRG